jgi:hypothetical protein
MIFVGFDDVLQYIPQCNGIELLVAEVSLFESEREHGSASRDPLFSLTIEYFGRFNASNLPTGPRPLHTNRRKSTRI